MRDKRHFERVQVYLDVCWEGLLGRYKATLSDIGLDGCFILTDGKVSKGELISVEIKSPTGEWLLLWGEVMQHDESIGIGINFTNMNNEAEWAQINELIDLLRAQKNLVTSLRALSDATQKSLSFDKYDSLISGTLHNIGDTMAMLSDGELKTKLASLLEPFTDAAQVWKFATTDGTEGRQIKIAIHDQLMRKYTNLPAEDLKRMLVADPVPVLTFLWEQGRARLNLAS